VVEGVVLVLVDNIIGGGDVEIRRRNCLNLKVPHVFEGGLRILLG
jgi:hypothetical protein